jgi:hypothetical protein
MSAKNRKKKSRRKEDYFTPAWTVRRLLDCVQLPKGRWLEPMAGKGHIIRAVRDKYGAYADFSAVELQSKYQRALQQSGATRTYCSDFFHIARHYPWRKKHLNLDVVIGNPAFSLAERLVRTLYELRPEYIVMLLRLNWLGSEERVDWLQKHMPDVYVLPNRPGFEAYFGKTDATEYAWMVWRPCVDYAGIGNIQVLGSTPLEERRNDHRIAREAAVYTTCYRSNLRLRLRR